MNREEAAQLPTQSRLELFSWHSYYLRHQLTTS